MSKKDNKLDANGENINTQRLAKTFSKAPDLLLTNSKNCQRSQNSRKNNIQPNLNVVRNKNLDVKTNEKDSKRDSNNRSRNQRGKDARQNNSRKVNNNLVQTMGFLSEGIGEALQRKSEYSGGYSKESGSNEPMIQKPRLTKRDFKHNKEDLEKEQKTLSNLLEENDIDDDESKASSDEIVPIKINNVSSSKVKVEDVKIKLEPVDCNVEAESQDIPLNTINGIKEEPESLFKSESFRQLFRPDANQAVLFQLPDMLPQKLPDDEEEVMNKGEDTETKAVPPKLSSLEHFSEGVIGKLIRYRSGKVKLMIGDYLYDIDNAISTDFQQHAVSISSNPQERSANMYSLGEITAKYNVIPDWNWLFDKVMTP